MRAAFARLDSAACLVGTDPLFGLWGRFLGVTYGRGGLPESAWETWREAGAAFARQCADNKQSVIPLGGRLKAGSTNER